MTGYIDENGARYLSWSYDCNSRATASETGIGANSVDLVYPNPNTTTVTHTVGDPKVFQASRGYYTSTSVNGVVLNTSTPEACAECGTVLSRTYDANGNVATSTDRNNALTTYTYDLTRNLETSRTEASGTAVARTTTTTWHPTLRLPIAVAQALRLTTITYDGAGNILTRTEQATSDVSGAAGMAATAVSPARTWTLSYTQAGLLETVTGPRTDILDRVTYAYDGSGNLDTVSNALGQVTTLSNYDAHGHARRIVAPNGVATDLDFTPRGWLASRSVTADGVVETTSYDFDGAGQVSKATQPDGSWISYEYDTAHRLTTIRDNVGNSIQYTLTVTGDHLRDEIRDPSGALARKVTRLFDSFSRLQKQTGVSQ